MRILLVEDEAEIRKLVQLNLEIEGYTVSIAEDGREAASTIEKENFDLVILDIMLPYISGFELCTMIRQKNLGTKIIILSANGDAEYKILGLKLGADDYLAKPFHLEELLLRVKNQLKNNNIQASPLLHSYSFGRNTIFFDSYIAQTPNGQIQLTAKESELLKLLIENENQVVSRDEILHKVWGYDMVLSTRTMDNIIVGFRKNFEIDQKNPIHFKTIRGVGYKFCKI